jgi:sugar phosphate isomerase/epimerase
MTPPSLAVCSWSLGPASAPDLVRLLGECGLDRVQLGLDPLAANAKGWQETRLVLNDAGVTVVSGMIGSVGEDYSTIARIRETGGVVPDATWPQTLENARRSAALAGGMGLKLVTLHAGFIPEDEHDPIFSKVVDRVGELADLFAGHGSAVALETGQESAAGLMAFLDAIGRDDVGVNFDPANMLLYGSGEPIAALRQLMPRVKQVHLKDATASPETDAWGTEVPVGRGEVAWVDFFATLREAGYAGDMVIEREAGPSRVADVRTAVEVARHHGVGQ